MRIELVNLEHGRGDFSRVYQPDELGSFDDRAGAIDERVTLVETVTVKGAVRLAGTEVFVNGHIKTRVAVECDRCLKQVELPVDADFELDYVTGQTYASTAAAELTENDLSVSVFDGETIDVDEIVKEQILLAVPTRTLCRPECKGICPECGNDKNTGDCACETKDVDPRWAALRNLTSGK
ncbi:MAG TPA: DUF177 domain-containing protein [Pyrinomonadaceae bacterium]|jgi:uncharacterized protein|nr:DUF177 domain-containing protein [Pyrinomonadaceae bacterium]